MKTLIQYSILSLALGAFASAGIEQAYAAPAKAKEVKIATKGEEMAYDTTKIQAKVGEELKITFTNKSSMQHNLVVVKPGTADQVANESIVAGAAKDWLAVGPNVLAHTKMLNPKQSETITFKPTAPGEYQFVCTFPGHSTMMRGVIVVK